MGNGMRKLLLGPKSVNWPACAWIAFSMATGLEMSIVFIETTWIILKSRETNSMCSKSLKTKLVKCLYSDKFIQLIRPQIILFLAMIRLFLNTWLGDMCPFWNGCFPFYLFLGQNTKISIIIILKVTKVSLEMSCYMNIAATSMVVILIPQKVGG